MPIAPESIQVGQCYLSQGGKVRRVLQFLPNGDVQFAVRNMKNTSRTGWRRETLIMDPSAFAASVEKPVPCDWTPEKDS